MREPFEPGFEPGDGGDVTRRLERLAAAGGEQARLAPAAEIQRRGRRRRQRNRIGGALLGVATVGALIQVPTLLPDGRPSNVRVTTPPASTAQAVPTTSPPPTTATMTTTTTPPSTTTSRRTTTTAVAADGPVTVRPSRITVGQRVTVRVTGCKPGVEVFVYHAGVHGWVPVGNARPDGTATRTFTPDFGPGKFDIGYSCGNPGEAQPDFDDPVKLTIFPKSSSPTWLRIHADAYEFKAGADIYVDGGLCPARSTVVLRVDGTRVGTATADADGFFTAEPRLPRGLPVGDYRLDGSCGGVRLAQSSPFSVYE